MIYELHKTTEDTKETICTIIDIVKTLAKCATWLKENTILPNADITRMIRNVSDEERSMAV